ncbi:MAG: Gfo/Idh/MocA family oxidoreductase [Candidatus Poribacteria bacterium]|nr:Gfo/Idh/MocA family oxidoreductase [Candidatus Poribacteria bacterium]
MSDQLKVGVIGTGLIGKSHINRYQSMRDDVEIIAVVDIDESEAQRVAQENAIPRVFSDYHDLLKIDEIDSVDVCLPNFLHAPVTIAALEAGKHVYCEKPMAKTGPEAQAMYDAAQRTGKKLAVQMGMVFSKEARTAKRLIEEGALGRVYYVKTSHYRRRGRPYVDGYATPHFVQKEKAGGGTLLDMAIYHMARMVYLLDNPEIETVTASTFQELDMDEKRRQEGGYNVEELGTGFVRFKGDITMFVEEAWAANIDGGEGDRIMGSKGGIRLEPFTLYTDMYGMDADVSFNIDAYERRMRSLGYMGDGYEGSQQHFVWGLLGRVQMIDTGAIGLTVARITEAMFQSAEARKEIDLR